MRLIFMMGGIETELDLACMLLKAEVTFTSTILYVLRTLVGLCLYDLLIQAFHLILGQLTF